MEKTQLITAYEWKKSQIVDENIDDQRVNPLIFKAQDFYIAESLGSTFYQHLMDAVKDDTLTNDETDLLNFYIKPALSEWIFYMSKSLLSTRTSNKGELNQSAMYAAAIDIKEKNEIKNEIERLADAYTKRLEKYLCDNSTLFPLYYNSANDENLHPQRKTNYTGVFISKKRGGCCKDNNEWYRPI